MFLCQLLTLCVQGIYLRNDVLSRYYALFVYANISIRKLKILHKFCKVLQKPFLQNFIPKVASLDYFSCAAVSFNKYNFYSVKILERNSVNIFTFSKEHYSMYKNGTDSNSL